MARAFAVLDDVNTQFSSDGTIYAVFNVTYVNSDPDNLFQQQLVVPVTVLSTDSSVVMQIKLSAAIKQVGAEYGLVVTNNEITQPAFLKGNTVYTPVRAASTGNINISSPGDTFDDVVFNPDDRILVKDQTNKAENGIYTFVAEDQPLVRAADANDGFEVDNGAAVAVVEGTHFAHTQWLISSLSPAPWVDGTSSITWSAFVFPPLS